VDEERREAEARLWALERRVLEGARGYAAEESGEIR
jgi:hypothetical protein